SLFVELIRPEGEPRMPYKQDPLAPDKVALIERWVKEGAKYDGASPDEDWAAVLRKNTPVVIPDVYAVTVPITALGFSTDGAAAGADRAIRIWEVASGKLQATIEDHADWIFDLAFSPDGKRLASASRDKTSKVFDVAKKESLVTFPGHAQTVNTVAFSPDGKAIVPRSWDGEFWLWNLAEGKPIKTIVAAPGLKQGGTTQVSAK